MNNQRVAGKAIEKQVARRIDGERIGLLGKDDVRTKRFSIEVKMRKKLPKFIKQSYEQAVRNCKQGLLPVLVLKEKGKRYNDAFVILNFKDFLWSIQDKNNHKEVK